MVPIMSPEAGNPFSDNGSAASPMKFKMAAIIAEQFVLLQLKIMQKLKNAIFRLG